MINAIILLGLSFSAEPWALPHAGKALNQNELTYFNECMIVEVSANSEDSDTRSVSTPAGTFEVEVLQQSASVVSSNFENTGTVTLTFTPHLPHTQKAGEPGWIEYPLQPGRYFVMGRSAKDGKLTAYPGFTAYGWPDESVYPPVPRAYFDASQNDDFAVFHIVPTSSRTLKSTAGDDADDVLKNLVSASLSSTRAGRLATYDLLLRTGHRAFEEWAIAALPASQLLVRKSQTESGTEKALMLLVAYHMGRHQVEAEMFNSLSYASKNEPAVWSTPQMARRLEFIDSAFKPTNERLARMRGHQRQIEILHAMADAGSESVRKLLARNLSSTFSGDMELPLVRLLRVADTNDQSLSRVLKRMAVWYEKPDKDPDTGTWDVGELVQYWLGRLGS